MVDITLAIGMLGLIPVAFLVYDRFFKTTNQYQKPEIVIEPNEQTRLNNNGTVKSYFLYIKNLGQVPARDVEVRLNKTVQNSKVTLLEDRYILHKLDYLMAGDSYPFQFIQDYGDKLLTPAGQDRIFPRENAIFTFIITGSNIQLKTVKMKMLWDEGESKYTFSNI